MSGYRQGHEQGHDPYIDYVPQSEAPPVDSVYGSHPNLQHGGAQGLSLHEHLGPPPQQQQQHHSQHHHQQQQIFTDPHGMAHHQSPQFGGGGQMIYGPPRQMQPQQTGSKRPRPDDLGLAMGGGLPEQQMQAGDMQGMPQSMGNFGGQAGQLFHSHPLPNQGERASKMPRIGEQEDQNQMGAPSVIGMAGMPEPAPRPRGPKLKFTADDDTLLIDLKENKSLTWKQIAEFFPGRSSGTLQVRYCTKLKAKTTNWTEETIQKLQTALHDYEQEKWRIIAQKVGTGFTSTACKEKAQEL